MQNNLKINIIAAVAVIALVFSFIGLFGHSSTPVSAGNFGSTNNGGTAVTIPANTTLPNGYQTPNPTTLDYIVSRGFLIAQNIFALGNGTSVPTYQQAIRMSLVSTATTTPCAIQNPLNATSSITNFALNITTASTTAGTFVVGTSTTAFATTTTMLTAQVVGANAFGTLTWEGGVNNTVIGPNQWIVVGVQGTNGTAGFIYGGNCQATFQSVN